MDSLSVILTLKILVSLVTVVYAAAIVAILRGYRTLHGQLNTLFFIATMITVIAFEARLRLGPSVTEQFSPEVMRALRVHLYFAVPSFVVLPVMYWSGRTGRRRLHRPLAVVFTVLWVGTFLTGVVTLPH